ncbi:unnamed protein product [Ceutorhynchus assimilis]|uniref:G-protein coupled receptors family 1 profile domain-containing protein n=1 Tax=Ceutorhynchus assimilis TaxID=467358 RepID=A0A9N9MVH9_9CUCU|nr:unnamed protein product [Ceutorhynchus assimilis]
MSYYFVSSAIAFRDEADLWCDAPTIRGVIVYSVVTPVLCCFGLITNTLSLAVLRRKNWTGSVYIYLAACVDLGTSLVLMLGGISYKWGPIIGLPLSGSLNTLGILAIVALTVDRAVYLWDPLRCAVPRFCTPRIAKRLMLASCPIALIFNLPYCFIFEWRDNGSLTTTAFFNSKFYNIFNWFTLFAFAVLPAIILSLGNGILIKSLKMATKINQKCPIKNHKRRNHTRLTIMLITMIVFFLITNVPENLAARSAAVNLLFSGDRNKAGVATLETLRQIATVLGAVDVNTNFVFYYVFCPEFSRVLGRICSRKRGDNLQVNVFVLNAIQVQEMSGKCPN